MASEIKVNKISPYSGNATNLGASGQKIQIPAGVTIANSATLTNFGGGKIIGMKSVIHKVRTAFAATAGSFTEITDLRLTYTAASTSNRLLFIAHFSGVENGTSWHCKFYNNTTSANPTNAVHPGESNRPGCTSKHNSNNGSWGTSIPMFAFVTPPNTSANEYTIMAASHSGGGYTNGNYNNNNSSSGDDMRVTCRFTIIEMDSSGL